MGSDFSLVKFHLANFYAILINSKPFFPTTTILMKVAKALVNSETDVNKDLMDRLEYIEENTHIDITEPLAIIELAVFRNLGADLDREISIDDKSYKIVNLYKLLDEAVNSISEVVTEVSKKYTFDMPTNLFTGGNSSSISGILSGK
jgi:hypothetical protein